MALNSPILSRHIGGLQPRDIYLYIYIMGRSRPEWVFLQPLNVLPDIPGLLIIEAIKVLPGIREEHHVNSIIHQLSLIRQLLDVFGNHDLRENG